ncbi:MAG: hypothetical protein JWQ89_3698 [Devosia sp.]|uniref:hypothetical protein n=1 Tax=Devosia sp. TaxID=1871048 RepID=UPI00262BE101|nr:hypothetical protein [Devosia sp.]MDB5541971.1 hypothetical protein [Devosia sp.]
MQTTEFARFNAMCGEGVWLVNADRVNLDDFIHASRVDGGVVRFHGDGDIGQLVRFVSGGPMPVEGIAGWISEDV